MKEGRKGEQRAHTKKIVLTSLSAMVAETTTFPIDMTKTRLQLHGESPSSTRPTNAVRVAAQIVLNEGLLGLYNGLSPAIIRHLFYTPIRIVGYEHLRNTLVPHDHQLSLSSKAIIGGISGVIAQIPLSEHGFQLPIAFSNVQNNSGVTSDHQYSLNPQFPSSSHVPLIVGNSLNSQIPVSEQEVQLPEVVSSAQTTHSFQIHPTNVTFGSFSSSVEVGIGQQARLGSRWWFQMLWVLMWKYAVASDVVAQDLSPNAAGNSIEAFAFSPPVILINNANGTGGLNYGVLEKDDGVEMSRPVEIVGPKEVLGECNVLYAPIMLMELVV
ncbi:unnamed protein product [Ilex paraguariensis]|uniref:Mitochondrial substrate carrier family protein n=1 Tax=Ilex paraguariensis TaxID=185542 RepID=A0ABC8QUM5_9AQUA